MKNKMILSFSGGRTSAYMTKYMIDNYSDIYDFIVLFANTGEEHPKTLDFVNNCDINFGFNTVWLESVVHHNKRKANTHKVVDYQSATRGGSLFEEMIKKHGIPNISFPHCTRELKLAPINSYLKSIGLSKKHYLMAIGIRADETRRVRQDAEKVKIVYPLVDAGIDKQFVLDWWENQSFDLEIEEHQGNCKWCWKKTTKKHFKNLLENSDWYDFPNEMESKYPFVGADYRKPNPPKYPRVFFRGNLSVNALKQSLNLSMGNLIPNENDVGCGDSCELFATA